MKKLERGKVFAWNIGSHRYESLSSMIAMNQVESALAIERLFSFYETPS
jgi:hypothetical protein